MLEIIIILIILLFAISVPVIFGCVCAHIAGNKGRNKVGYFFLGLFLSAFRNHRNFVVG